LIPESRKTGVSATWMTCATLSTVSSRAFCNPYLQGGCVMAKSARLNRRRRSQGDVPVTFSPGRCNRQSRSSQAFLCWRRRL
jgi:hypothetical protein